MAKKGMKRPDRTHTQPRNELDPVPELQGAAKQSKEKAKPIISGTKGSGQKVYHTGKPIPSDVYPATGLRAAVSKNESSCSAISRRKSPSSARGSQGS